MTIFFYNVWPKGEKMIVPLQFDLFKSPQECEMEALRNSNLEIKKSLEKVRKGTYARINELTKQCVDLTIRLELMERNICQENKC